MHVYIVREHINSLGRTNHSHALQQPTLNPLAGTQEWMNVFVYVIFHFSTPNRQPAGGGLGVAGPIGGGAGWLAGTWNVKT